MLLFHANKPLSRAKGVWVNPHVRVAYRHTSRSILMVRGYPCRQSSVAYGETGCVVGARLHDQIEFVGLAGEAYLHAAPFID